MTLYVETSTGIGFAADPTPAPMESLSSLLRDISPVERLSREQEGNLFAQVRAGDAEARRQCIEANIPLVVFVAKDYHPYCRAAIAFEDLIQEGCCGLMRAVEKYDPARGTFSNYAVYWIRQAISRALHNQQRTIRLPSHVCIQLSRLARHSARLCEAQEEEPTVAQLAEAMGLSAEQVERLQEIDTLPVSLDRHITSHDDRTTLADTLVDPQVCDPDEMAQAHLEARALPRLIQEALTSLTEQERRVLVRRFGLDGSPERTLREVGEILNLSRERVRQLEARALSKLRQPEQAALLAGFLFQKEDAHE